MYDLLCVNAVAFKMLSRVTVFHELSFLPKYLLMVISLTERLSALDGSCVGVRVSKLSRTVVNVCNGFDGGL